MSRPARLVLAIALVAILAALVACKPTAPSLDGTSWTLTGWSASGDPSGFKVTLAIKGSELTGKAPVNSYGGKVKITKDGGFVPGDINRTLMAGPEPQMKAEETYFGLLGEVKKYSVEGGKLMLADGKGKNLLTFSANK